MYACLLACFPLFDQPSLAGREGGSIIFSWAFIPYHHFTNWGIRWTAHEASPSIVSRRRITHALS